MRGVAVLKDLVAPVSTHDALGAGHLVEISTSVARQNDRLGVGLISDQYVGAQRPVIVHRVVVYINTKGQIIAVAEVLDHAELIADAHELLLHEPDLLRDDALTGIHYLTSCKGGLDSGRRQWGRQSQRVNVGRQRLGVTVVDHRVRIQVPAVKYEAVADRPAVAECLVQT